MEPTVLLAGLALALTLGAGAIGIGSQGPVAGVKLAVTLASLGLAGLAGAVLLEASSLDAPRAAAAARQESTTRALAQAADARAAQERRLDEVTAGLRAELHSRDRDRVRLDERVNALAGDLQALQVSTAELRRMLVDVTGTQGLLITREGRFVAGADSSAFEPCGWGEAWQVAFSPSAENKGRLVELLDGRSVAPVIFTGVLSTPGEYGPDGASRHLFLVIDGAPSERTDCD